MKEAFYFSHDCNAANDPKILAMRSVYKASGYGWYWILIEMMRQQEDYRLSMKGKYVWNALATQLQCEPDEAHSFITDCIDEFDLFATDREYFWSESLLRRMKIREEKSDKARQSAANKWGSKLDQQNRLKRSERLTEARKKGTHTKEEWEEMKQYFNYTCVRCLGKSGSDKIVKDHITPIYQGGSDGIDNIQPLCDKCNSSKGPENIDFRLEYCGQFGLEMPAEFLQNACEMPAIKESKVNKSKVKEITISPNGDGDSDPIDKNKTTLTVEVASDTTENQTYVDDPDSPKSEYHQPASLLPTSQHMSTATTLEPTAEKIILKPDEAEFFAVLEKVKDYPLDRQKDLEYYHILAERYPNLDLLSALKDWQIHKIGKPLKPKDNARSQINNWFQNAVKWGKNKKSSPRPALSGGTNDKFKDFIL